MEGKEMAVGVLMPKAGITVEECIITEWLKKKGDHVNVGDILFTYEPYLELSMRMTFFPAFFIIRLFTSISSSLPQVKPLSSV